MSEERMIRVTKEDMGLLLGTDQMTLPRKKWEELEPVAPKDWVPHCYKHRDIPGCSGSADFTRTTQPAVKKECEYCPYRKKRE